MGIALLATGTVARAGSVLSATKTAPLTTGASIPYTVQYSQLYNLNNPFLISLPPVGGQVRSGEA
jgi:hypothetical protein